MPAVAVTDHGNLFGAVEFYQKAMEHGVKPIIGCEVYVAPASRLDKSTQARGASVTAYHLVLLVKNPKGYHNLCKLLSKAYIEGFHYKPRVDKELLLEFNDGLIAMSACLHGEVAHNIGMGRMQEALAAASWYQDVFKDRRFFLELQKNGLQEQEKVNAGLLDIACKLKLPVVATNDCHYLDKNDSKVHDILLCIQTGTTVNVEKRLRFSTDQLYVKSPEEMTLAFADVPEAIANTIEIAERCNFEFKLGEHHLPEFPVPEGQTLEGIIETKAKAGLERRLVGMDDAEKLHYYDRLLKELNVIKRMGYPGYFLIVEDFIRYARSKGIPVGPGRGSAAGSLVAYCLGITNLDPIKHNLLFERFLNPDRISLPDIDIDFCFEKRDEVINYVTEKYGKDNVTQIITFGQLKAKAVIRDVGRALDMPYGDVDRIAKLVPNELDITIESAVEKEPRLKKLIEEDHKVAALIDAAKALEGLPRHASTHAAGVVIANKPLVEYLPLYKSPKEDVVTTQYAMKDVEKIGLVKFDFLGLKTLTVIDKTISLARLSSGRTIDIDNIPLDDPKPYGLIASGNTNGVFQLESSGIKEMVRKLKPENFEEITAAIALYRPGPLQSGMVEDFINRKHKRVPIQYDLPDLKGILENTYGVMVYQEQVMEISRVLAGFTPGEADSLRKAMGKKLPEVMLAQRTRFLDGAKKKNVPAKLAEKIFDLIVKFAGYGFNKSHSAVYALIAYQTAYLKVYYPVEFMAALLGSDMGVTDKVVKYVNECREMNISLDPPDMNESLMEFTVAGNRIRYGLGAIKNVGSAAIDGILEVRRIAPFTSLVDFLSRVDSRKANKKVIESLIKCGAFDFTGTRRIELLNSLERDMDIAQASQRDRNIGQKSIFDMFGDGAGALSAPVALQSLKTAKTAAEDKENLAFEKETLGFYLSSHPLAPYKALLAAHTSHAIDALSELNDEAEVIIGGVGAEVKEITTKKGDRMAFVRIEDMTGAVEVTLFADMYAKVRDKLSTDAPFIISGKLDKRDNGEVKLTANSICLLDEVKDAPRKVKGRCAHIIARAGQLDENGLSALKDVLKANPGTSPVILHLMSDEGEVIIGASDELRISDSEDALLKIRGLDGVSDARVQ